VVRRVGVELQPAGLERYGMLSGTIAGTYQSEGWTLNEESGEERKFSVRQEFSPPFIHRPSVALSVAELDAPAGPLRVRVYASDISNTGFTANIETWADSKVYGVVASWIAYQP
jgi:hypothetical protein